MDCTRALLFGVCLVLVLVITQGRASLVTEPVEGWTARATGRAGLPLVLSKGNVPNISGLDISELDLPSRDLAGSIRHRSCALVGNSGALLGGNQGRAIDSHDAVMRVNYPLIRGWEADVGSKTTYDFVNGFIAGEITKGNGRFREVPWRTPESTLLMYTGMSTKQGILELYAPLHKKFPLARAHFTHSAFILRNVALWNELKDEFEKTLNKTYHSKPMSGFYAVTFMMQLCDSLTLFGFEAHPKNDGKVPCYYFDRNHQCSVHVHSFDLFFLVVKAIGDMYPLTIAPRDRLGNNTIAPLGRGSAPPPKKRLHNLSAPGVQRPPP